MTRGLTMCGVHVTPIDDPLNLPRADLCSICLRKTPLERDVLEARRLWWMNKRYVVYLLRSEPPHVIGKYFWV